MPGSDDSKAGRVVDELPNRPLEFREMRALEAQEGSSYVTQPLLLLTTESWAGMAAFTFYLVDRDEFNVLGYSSMRRTWEVVASIDGCDDWLERQKAAVDDWADDALAEIDAEREYVATEEPPW